MDNNIKNIIKNVMNYLELKKECIDKQYENLYDVITLFINEVYELNDIICSLEKSLNKFDLAELIENKCSKSIINTYEEYLVNEITDVLLTSARLIYEFNLQEPLSEMIEYKYERQKSRELKRFKNVKNELLK